MNSNTSAAVTVANTVFGRHLAATNSTYRSNTPARPDGPTTTPNDDIPTIPDQPRTPLDEKQPAASPITGISTVLARCRTLSLRTCPACRQRQSSLGGRSDCLAPARQRKAVRGRRKASADRRSYVCQGACCRCSGRPVMGHSGEGRLLLGHGPAECCGGGTACRFEDNRVGRQAVMGPVPSPRSGQRSSAWKVSRAT